MTKKTSSQPTSSQPTKASLKDFWETLPPGPKLDPKTPPRKRKTSTWHSPQTPTRRTSGRGTRRMTKYTTTTSKSSPPQQSDSEDGEVGGVRINPGDGPKDGTVNAKPTEYGSGTDGFGRRTDGYDSETDGYDSGTDGYDSETGGGVTDGGKGDASVNSDDDKEEIVYDSKKFVVRRKGGGPLA